MHLVVAGHERQRSAGREAGIRADDVERVSRNLLAFAQIRDRHGQNRRAAIVALARTGRERRHAMRARRGRGGTATERQARECAEMA